MKIEENITNREKEKKIILKHKKSNALDYELNHEF